ncbi:hypothetical protein GGR56DRAFT_60355 [Xylariaceae sp. FL0804]|nr:hypothetical protein GGR56DRAFT_60355 [Xylariaceae sp. FL0804]
MLTGARGTLPTGSLTNHPAAERRLSLGISQRFFPSANSATEDHPHATCAPHSKSTNPRHDADRNAGAETTSIRVSPIMGALVVVVVVVVLLLLLHLFRTAAARRRAKAACGRREKQLAAHVPARGAAPSNANRDRSGPRGNRSRRRRRCRRCQAISIAYSRPSRSISHAVAKNKEATRVVDPLRAC